MVEHLDSSDLKKMDKADLKAHIRQLEAAGYSINYEQVKELAKQSEDPLKVLRKQIRQAYSNAPKEPPKFDSDSAVKRGVELEKLVKKSKNGELDLITIAKALEVKRYTTMNKAELIAAIVKEESVKGKFQPDSPEAKAASPKRKSSASPAKVSKAKSSSSSDDEPSLEKQLNKAAKSGDLKKVKSLLSQGVAIQDEAIRNAVSGGHQEIVLFMMNYKGAPVKKSPKKMPVKVEEKEEEIEEKEEEEEKEASDSSVNSKKEKDYSKKLAKKNITLLDESRGKELYKQYKANKSTCDESNDYECPDGLACDVSSKPGVCVDSESAAKNPKSIMFKGHQIVGSKAAIKILKNKLKSEEKMCGTVKYADLLSKSLEKLQKAMGKANISTEGLDKQKTADLACEFFSNDQAVCSEENNYACPDDLACDVSSNPGICVSKNYAAGEANFLEYEGKKIVGSKAAIDILRKRLEGQSSPVDKKRNKLIKKLMILTGKSEKKLSKKTTEELKEMLESVSVNEDKSKKIIRQDTEEAPQEDDEVEEQIKSPSKKEKKPKSKSVEKLLSNVKPSKDSENDFSEAQRTILKCLGLAA